MSRTCLGVFGNVLSPLSGLSWPVSPPAFFVFWHQFWQWVGRSVLLLVPPQCVPLKSTLNFKDIKIGGRGWGTHLLVSDDNKDLKISLSFLAQQTLHCSGLEIKSKILLKKKTVRINYSFTVKTSLTMLIADL